MNRFPAWKHALAAAVVAAGFFYAAPSLFPNSPVVQIRATEGRLDESATLRQAEESLAEAGIAAASTRLLGRGAARRVEIKFAAEEEQIAARALLARDLGDGYVVAYNRASDAPPWLAKLGATPIALGLDLRGGVYFLLQVDSEFAFQKRLKGLSDAVAETLIEARLAVESIEISQEQIWLTPKTPADLEAAIAAALVLSEDLELVTEPGQSPARFALLESARDRILDLTMEQNVETLRRRIDELGVAEPVITRQGRDRIAAQLPGVQDTARAKNILGRTAALELRGVDERRSSSPSLLRRAKEGRAVAGADYFPERDGPGLFLEKRHVVTGENITDASPGLDNNNRPAVNIALDAPGAQRMKRYTRARVGERLAILLIDRDRGEIISAPVVQEELAANFIVHGNMGTAEASELALLLRAGALAAPLAIIEERTVGPSLGADNIRRGLSSVAGGFVAIAFFIALYYALMGIISVAALFANLVLLSAALGLLGATLTLPGLAGFALTLGMAIDANVLINERVREEFDLGQSASKAVAAGYERAWTTILDSNLTTLIAGAALFVFGEGPVRGFAVVLCFGLLTSMFSAVQVSRSLVNVAVERRRRVGLPRGFRFLAFRRVLPLMSWRGRTATVSAILLLVCAVSLGWRGLNLGVDFTGGTVIEAAFEKTPSIGAARQALAEAGLSEAPIQLSGEGTIIVKASPRQAGESGAALSEAALAGLRELDPGVVLRRVEFVGPQVGAELLFSGALALIFVMIGIAVYLSLRFKWRLAVGAIVANFHDVFFILGLFSIFQWEFNLPVLAATLAILGYSVNESVVIFDRVRENLRASRANALVERVLDESIAQTWSRTIITHGSTQLAVLSMLFFGGEPLFYFALALTIGIFASIYSSVLVSGPLALRLGLAREDLLPPKEVKSDNPAGAVV